MRIFLSCLLLITSFSIHANSIVRIAAAADIQPALIVIEQQFKQQYPAAPNISITYGASGVLTSQIRQGAPFELFLSANEEFPDILIQQGLSLNAGAIYAFGRIAFITHADIEANTAIDAFDQWLALKTPSERLSIANPIHAPNGITALNWLEHWQMDELVSQNLVFGENASQSVQFVLSGAAYSGIVAWPLIVKRDEFAEKQWLIPKEEHVPSPRKMVLMNQSSETAIAFYEFMQSDIAIEILQDYGFGVP